MEGTRTDGHDGYLRIALEPSARIDPGIFIGVNDHYDVSEGQEEVGTPERALALRT